jgi:sugar O-acyltransferase (sialic acid O-acetyltransferase NeuD family)
MHSEKGDLVIVGAGGLGREVLWVARATDWRPIGFLDDVPVGSFLDAPYLGPVAAASKFRNAHFVIAIGEPRLRKSVADRMTGDENLRFATVIHPSALLSNSVQVGVGTVISAACIATVQVRIGSHVILDRGVNVGHDCVIGDFCTVSPLVPVAGGVTLEDGVWIGASAAIRQGVVLRQGSMAGMGAVVVRDVAANQVVTGSPARPLKKLPAWS